MQRDDDESLLKKLGICVGKFRKRIKTEASEIIGTCEGVKRIWECEEEEIGPATFQYNIEANIRSLWSV